MKRFYQILFLLAFVPMLAAAQEQTKQTFTLDQCIEYALQNSVNAKNAVLDLEIAEQVILERKSEGLPQITGSVAIQDNIKLPRFFTKYDPNGISIGGDLSTVPGIQAGDVVAAQNFFQLPASGNAGLTVNQLLFNSSYFLGLKAMKTYRDLTHKTADQTKEAIVVNVTKAYYLILINNDRLGLFETNLARIDSLLKNTSAMNKNGFAEEIDVDRVKVAYNNVVSQLAQFRNLQDLGLQLLKFQMSYPSDQPLTITGDMASLKIDESVLGAYSDGWNYDRRVEYQILETNHTLAELDVKSKRSRAYPTLYAFYNLGYQTQSPTIAGLFRTESGIKDYGAIGPDKWYQFSSYGVTLNVPIFSGLQRYASTQQARFTQRKIENSIDQMKQAIDLEVKQASVNFINATKELKIQEENKTLSEKVARVTKVKYQQGVGSNLEVVDAESALKEAQINYYNALYNASVAKVDLDKAYGKLIPQATTETK